MAQNSFLKFMLVYVVLSTILAVVWGWVKHSKGIRHNGKIDVEMAVCDQQLKTLVPEWTWADDTTVANLMEMSQSVVAAYTNSNVEAMKNAYGKLLEKCEHVATEQYSKVCRPLFRILNTSFMSSNVGSHAYDVEKLSEFVRLNRTLIMLLEKGDVKRKFFTERVFNLEHQYLRRLYDYRSYFRELGRTDLNEVVDFYIKEWIDIIDSPSGISYNFVHWDLKLNLHLTSGGIMTKDEAIGASRRWMLPLAKLLGRDPKWIDEIK